MSKKPRYSKPHTIKATSLPAALSDDQVLLFGESIKLNRLSDRGGRRILAGPDAPHVVQLSTHRIGITVAANKEWQARRTRSKRAAS